MALVPMDVISKWYTDKNSLIYQWFRYIYVNPAWNNSKGMPRGMSVCPYFWMSVLVGGLLMHTIIVPIALIIKFILKIFKFIFGDIIFGKIDRFLFRWLNFNEIRPCYTVGHGWMFLMVWPLLVAALISGITACLFALVAVYKVFTSELFMIPVGLFLTSMSMLVLIKPTRRLCMIIPSILAYTSLWYLLPKETFEVHRYVLDISIFWIGIALKYIAIFGLYILSAIIGFIGIFVLLVKGGKYYHTHAPEQKLDSGDSHLENVKTSIDGPKDDFKDGATISLSAAMKLLLIASRPHRLAHMKDKYEYDKGFRVYESNDVKYKIPILDLFDMANKILLKRVEQEPEIYHKLQLRYKFVLKVIDCKSMTCKCNYMTNLRDNVIDELSDSDIPLLRDVYRVYEEMDPLISLDRAFDRKWLDVMIVMFPEKFIKFENDFKTHCVIERSKKERKLKRDQFNNKIYSVIKRMKDKIKLIKQTIYKPFISFWSWFVIVLKAKKEGACPFLFFDVKDDE